MKHFQQYWPLYLFCIAMFLAWGGWGIVYHNTAVYVSRDIALTLFYSSLFASVFFTAAFFLTLMKMALLEENFFHKILKTSLRQSFLLALFASLLLFFQQLDLLTMMTGIMAFLVLLLVEVFFWERRTPKREDEEEPTLFDR